MLSEKDGGILGKDGIAQEAADLMRSARNVRFEVGREAYSVEDGYVLVSAMRGAGENNVFNLFHELAHFVSCKQERLGSRNYGLHAPNAKPLTPERRASMLAFELEVLAVQFSLLEHFGMGSIATEEQHRRFCRAFVWSEKERRGLADHAEFRRCVDSLDADGIVATFHERDAYVGRMLRSRSELPMAA